MNTDCRERSFWGLHLQSYVISKMKWRRPTKNTYMPQIDKYMLMFIHITAIIFVIFYPGISVCIYFDKDVCDLYQINSFWIQPEKNTFLWSYTIQPLYLQVKNSNSKGELEVNCPRSQTTSSQSHLSWNPPSLSCLSAVLPIILTPWGKGVENSSSNVTLSELGWVIKHPEGLSIWCAEFQVVCCV